MTVSPSGEEYASFGRVEVEEELPRFLKRLNAFRHEYETSHSRDLAPGSLRRAPGPVPERPRARFGFPPQAGPGPRGPTRGA